MYKGTQEDKGQAVKGGYFSVFFFFTFSFPFFFFICLLIFLGVCTEGWGSDCQLSSFFLSLFFCHDFFTFLYFCCIHLCFLCYYYYFFFYLWLKKYEKRISIGSILLASFIYVFNILYFCRVYYFSPFCALVNLSSCLCACNSFFNFLI